MTEHNTIPAFRHDDGGGSGLLSHLTYDHKRHPVLMRNLRQSEMVAEHRKLHDAIDAINAANFRAALREADEISLISPSDLQAASDMYDQIAEGTFYTDQEAAVRALNRTETRNDADHR